MFYLRLEVRFGPQFVDVDVGNLEFFELNYHMLLRRTGTDSEKIRITSDNRRGEEEMESGHTLATTRECCIVDWIVLQPHRILLECLL